MKFRRIIKAVLTVAITAMAVIGCVSAANTVEASTLSDINIVNTKWIHSGDKWYWSNSDGTFAKGWKLIDGNWYYFMTGTDANGNTHNGEMVTGVWTFDNHKTFYGFDSNGIMVKNKWFYYGNEWFYATGNGTFATGWKQIGGKWYFFNKQNYGTLTTGWKQIGGYWYYFDQSGVMKTDWQAIKGKWYYFNSDGVMQTGWQKIGGNWYYFDSNGVMQTGWQKISNKWYYFYSSGKMASNTTIDGCRLNSSGVWVL